MLFRTVIKLIRWICVFLLMANLQAAAAADPKDRGAVASAGCLRGTFIQLVSDNWSWPKERWEQLFSQLDDLKISKVIVQWSVIDGQALYPSRNFKSTGQPVLEWILSLADKYRMSVMVGLVHQSSHWEVVGKVDQRNAYLVSELGRIAQSVDELVPIVAGHESFGGWYISQEIDDLNWKDQTSNDNLRSFLFQTTTLLKTVTPKARVGVSAFANNATAPEEIGAFWNRMLAQVKNLDIVYFQDGIGVHKLDLTNLPAYYKAMNTVAANNKREMVPVIELFTQTGGMPINDNPFTATAAPLERVLDQIALADAYSNNHVVFSVPEYLSSFKDLPAQEAFDKYTAHMKAKGLSCKVR